MNLLLELEATHTDLLTILPEMYKQLCSHPVSLAQLSEPGIPALKTSWVDPLHSRSSPYGPEVSKGLADALSNCDLGLLDRYLMELCEKQAEVLKRQRGAAYGFGDVDGSEEMITSQVDAANLDKGSYTHQSSGKSFW